jgi:hypothetical protein
LGKISEAPFLPVFGGTLINQESGLSFLGTKLGTSKAMKMTLEPPEANTRQTTYVF